MGWYGGDLVNTYMVTFNRKSYYKNGWLEITASSHDTVTDFAEEYYGGEWSHVYAQSEFNPQFFPDGCLGRVTV